MLRRAPRAAASRAKALTKATLHRAGLEIARRRDPHQLGVYDALFDAATLARRPFYNVGAGSFWHPHWTNIDFVSDWYAGVQRDVVHHDLMSGDPLPIETGAALLIYTEHTVEHVSEEAVERLFREAHRALAPGGVFRVTTGPDAVTDFRAMQAGDTRWFYWDDEFYSKPGSYEEIYRAPANSVPIEERWLHHVASALAPNDLSPSEIKLDAAAIRKVVAERGRDGALDYFTSLVEFDPQRPGNHISWWSHDKLLELLGRVGFDGYRSGYRQSVSPLLRSPLHDATHPQITAYVEAIR